MKNGGLFPWGVEEREEVGGYNDHDLAASCDEGVISLCDQGLGSEPWQIYISYYPSLLYYLKTLFQTSKQKILSQACSLSPVDSHDEYWYLINEFIFFFNILKQC